MEETNGREAVIKNSKDGVQGNQSLKATTKTRTKATKEARTDTPRSSTSWMEKKQARMVDVPFAGGKGSTSVRSAQGGTTAHL